MTSKEIKAIVIYNYGFKKGFNISTELSYSNYIADILCLSNKDESKITEIEIKCSKADILTDFRNKSEKHSYLENDNSFPNVFYFCVPSELVVFTKEILCEYNKNKYGIIEVSPYWKYKNKKQEQLILDRSIKIVKPAKKLHEISKDTYLVYLHRMLRRNSNELIGMYKESVWGVNRYKSVLREIEERK